MQTWPAWLAHRYAGVGATECIPCVPNAEVGSNGCMCMAGFFARSAETPPTACEKCPVGVACPRSGNTWGPALELELGYWQDRAWVGDVDKLLAIHPRKCKLGQWTAEQVDVDPLCIGGANWTKCRVGHDGVMCQACVKGEDRPAFYKEKSGLCRACLASGVGVPLAIVGVLLLGATAGYVVSQKKKNDNNKSKSSEEAWVPAAVCRGSFGPLHVNVIMRHGGWRCLICCLSRLCQHSPLCPENGRS